MMQKPHLQLCFFSLQGGGNMVAIDLIVQHVHSQLEEVSLFTLEAGATMCLKAATCIHMVCTVTCSKTNMKQNIDNDNVVYIRTLISTFLRFVNTISDSTCHITTYSIYIQFKNMLLIPRREINSSKLLQKAETVWRKTAHIYCCIIWINKSKQQPGSVNQMHLIHWSSAAVSISIEADVLEGWSSYALRGVLTQCQRCKTSAMVLGK